MTERPIIFSGPMVRAILDGRKTQTRRLVKPQPPVDEFGRPAHGKILGPEHFEPVAYDRHGEMQPGPEIFGAYDDDGEWGVRCPWEPSDRLYVRETWGALFTDPPGCPDGRKPQPGDDIRYRADPGQDWQWRDGSLPWRPSIHMPKWAARLWLEVTGVRVERLQSITPADAIAEGIAPAANSQTIDCDTPSPVDRFRDLWDSLNAKRAPWDSNPWVWAIEFRPITETTP